MYTLYNFSFSIAQYKPPKKGAGHKYWDMVCPNTLLFFAIKSHEGKNHGIINLSGGRGNKQRKKKIILVKDLSVTNEENKSFGCQFFRRLTFFFLRQIERGS